MKFESTGLPGMGIKKAKQNKKNKTKWKQDLDCWEVTEGKICCHFPDSVKIWFGIRFTSSTKESYGFSWLTRQYLYRNTKIPFKNWWLLNSSFWRAAQSLVCWSSYESRRVDAADISSLVRNIYFAFSLANWTNCFLGKGGIKYIGWQYAPLKILVFPNTLTVRVPLWPS